FSCSCKSIASASRPLRSSTTLVRTVSGRSFLVVYMALLYKKGWMVWFGGGIKHLAGLRKSDRHQTIGASTYLRREVAEGASLRLRAGGGYGTSRYIAMDLPGI